MIRFEALMGTNYARKTALRDMLAKCISLGVDTGDMLVNVESLNCLQDTSNMSTARVTEPALVHSLASQITPRNRFLESCSTIDCLILLRVDCQLHPERFRKAYQHGINCESMFILAVNRM